MNTKELIMDYLQKQGLVPSSEEYGIDFKYQMRSFSILIDDDDEQFLRIVMPCIFSVTDENRVEVLEAINVVNMGVKVSKTGIWGEDSVSIFIETLLDKDPALDDIIPRSLNIMLYTRDEFFKALQG